MSINFYIRLLVLSSFSLLIAQPIIEAYPMHRTSLTDQSLVEMLLGRFSISKAYLTSDARVARWQEYYLNDSYHLKRVLHNMAPFLPLMMKGIDTYNLPGEIALIPVIECCYRTTEVSAKGAKGLWQINPITAEHLELYEQWDYQPCFDIARSTQAALSYLADLHERFGSWPLALAAYNAGPKVVQKAIAQVPYRGQRDLESLPLPEQTKDFVAKIQALAQILLHYDHYGVLVSFEADPLVVLSPKLPIDVRDLMLAFNIPLSVIEYYNPSITHYKTPKGHKYQWLIPQSFLEGQSSERSEIVLYQSRQYPFYKVKAGDNLTKIAKHFGISVHQLMTQNNMQSTRIYPGQLIQIPPLSQCRAPVVIHEVQAGESLWSIARKYGARWEELQEVNSLLTHHLKPKQVLIIPAETIKKIS